MSNITMEYCIYQFKLHDSKNVICATFTELVFD